MAAVGCVWQGLKGPHAVAVAGRVGVAGSNTPWQQSGVFGRGFRAHTVAVAGRVGVAGSNTPWQQSGVHGHIDQRSSPTLLSVLCTDPHCCLCVVAALVCVIAP